MFDTIEESISQLHNPDNYSVKTKSNSVDWYF